METPNKKRHIPAELIEKILSNLPMKSLLRFSTVSKSWNLTIFERKFVESYRGREMVVLRSYSDGKALVCARSSLSSEINPIDKATAFIHDDSYSPAASCGELWCLEFENSLVLYNPSMRTYRKVANPSAPVPVGSPILGYSESVYVYGLGYAAKDYRIVKIHKEEYVESELYSLKSDSWRTVESRRPSRVSFPSSKGVVLSGGVIHWLVRRHKQGEWFVWDNVILSFDLSTGKYGKLKKLPKIMRSRAWRRLDISVVRGKLHVCLNYGCHPRFGVWVMEEDDSWRNLLKIDYAHSHPLRYSCLKLLYIHHGDGDGDGVGVTSSNNMAKIFVYKDGTSLEKNFASNGCAFFNTGFTYIESFVSPSTSNSLIKNCTTS